MNDEIKFSVRKTKICGFMWLVLAIVWGVVAIVCFIAKGMLAAAVPIIMCVGCFLMGLSKILRAQSFRFEIYGGRIYSRSGIINIQESIFMLTGIVGVSVRQGLLGKIFNYGEVVVDKVGKEWDINLEDILNPYELKEILEIAIDKAAKKENSEISN